MFRKITHGLCLLCVFCLLTAAAMADSMSLYAVNVRKGDCLILRSGSSTYMIDTGKKEQWGDVSAALQMCGITHLDGVILTHTDGDHCGGMMALAASSIEVDHWYASKYYADVKSSKHPAKLAAAVRGAQVEWLKAGDVLPLDGGTLQVLGPVNESEIENCNSVVLRAEAAGGSFLLTGDMEFDEEQDLLEAGLLSPCTVLKVANHAEKDATSQTLVNVLHPKLAIISTCSEDEPDTPAPRVLKALLKFGSRIVITQDAPAGVLVTMEDGKLTTQMLDWPQWPEQINTVQMTAKDNKAGTTTVTNVGSEPVDVSGWFIYSERGGETFVFPQGSVISAGDSVTISCLSSEQTGDYVWQDTKVWHASKEDAGILYDVYGRMINRLE